MWSFLPKRHIQVVGLFLFRYFPPWLYNVLVCRTIKLVPAACVKWFIFTSQILDKNWVLFYPTIIRFKIKHWIVFLMFSKLLLLLIRVSHLYQQSRNHSAMKICHYVWHEKWSRVIKFSYLIYLEKQKKINLYRKNARKPMQEVVEHSSIIIPGPCSSLLV